MQIDLKAVLAPTRRISEHNRSGSKMKALLLWYLVALALICSFVQCSEEEAVTDNTEIGEQKKYKQISDKYVANDSIYDDNEPHERVKRGWRRVRFRRVRNVVRKVGRAVRKVAKVTRRITRKIKSNVKRTARKIKDTAKKIVRRAKLPYIKKKLIGIRNKVKNTVGKLIRRNKQEVHREPEDTPTEEESCDSDCMVVLNSLLADISFTDQAYCAFYSIQRKHRDFLVDRNANFTLPQLLNDYTLYSWLVYRDVSQDAKLIKPALVFSDNLSQIRNQCNSQNVIKCGVMKTNHIAVFYTLKCLQPCIGLQGCEEEDKLLSRSLDNAMNLFDKKINNMS